MLIVKVSGKDSSKVLKGKKKLAEGELKKKYICLIGKRVYTNHVYCLY